MTSIIAHQPLGLQKVGPCGGLPGEGRDLGVGQPERLELRPGRGPGVGRGGLLRLPRRLLLGERRSVSLLLGDLLGGHLDFRPLARRAVDC